MSALARRSASVPPGDGSAPEREDASRPPTWGTVAAAQARLVARKRWKTLAAIPLGMGLFVLPWLYMVLVDAGASPDGVSVSFVDLLLGPLYFLVLLVGFAWALTLWSDEGPGDRAYHWSLPVERPVHDLTRLGVGAVWFLAAGVAGVLVWGLGWNTFAGGIRTGSLEGLLIGASGPGLAYLLGSVPALLCDRPLRWTAGSVLGYAVGTGVLMEIAKRWSWLSPLPDVLASVWSGELGLRAAVLAPRHLAGVVEAPVENVSPTSEPGLALLLWVVLAAAAVVGLSFVHLERAKGAAE